jgi:hypothetical protein
MIKTAVMKLLTVKAAAVIAVTAAGGVAVAATTGTMPTVLTGSGHRQSGVSAADSRRAGKPSPEPSASAKGKDHDRDAKEHDGKGHDGTQGDGKEHDGQGPAGAQGSPSPSLIGLCHAVDAGNKDEHGKALDNPAFTALITAAGGKDKVDLFCATLLASASAAPNEHPSHPANSSDDNRTGPPADHGKPSTQAHP